MECQDLTGETEFPVCQEKPEKPVNEEKEVSPDDTLSTKDLSEFTPNQID